MHLAPSQFFLLVTLGRAVKTTLFIHNEAAIYTELSQHCNSTSFKTILLYLRQQNLG